MWMKRDLALCFALLLEGRGGELGQATKRSGLTSRHSVNSWLCSFEEDGAVCWCRTELRDVGIRDSRDLSKTRRVKRTETREEVSAWGS